MSRATHFCCEVVDLAFDRVDFLEQTVKAIVQVLWGRPNELAKFSPLSRGLVEPSDGPSVAGS